MDMGATLSSLVLGSVSLPPGPRQPSYAGTGEGGVAPVSSPAPADPAPTVPVIDPVIESLAVNGYGKARSQIVNGREYLVAPMTLIVPGVLSGNMGPLYYPPEEITRNVDAWNGVPLVVMHPTRNGQYVTGRDPYAMANAEVGRVYNAHIDKDHKLKAEAWFDVAATERVDHTGTIIPRLRRGEPIELSTGLFTKNIPHRGVANGRQYTHVATDYKPDHLAILPDRSGACSLKDGCGVLVNQRTVMTTGDLVLNALKPSTKLKKSGMTPEKACKILEDGKANGTPLSEKQRGMFGVLCGQRKTNNELNDPDDLYPAEEVDDDFDPDEEEYGEPVGSLGNILLNAFCPTGKGGGIKTDCSPKGLGGGKSVTKSATKGAAKRTFGAGGKVAGTKGAGTTKTAPKTAPKAPAKTAPTKAPSPAKKKTVVKVSAPELKAAKKLAKAAADAKKKGDAEGEAKAKLKLKRIVSKAQEREKARAEVDKKTGGKAGEKAHEEAVGRARAAKAAEDRAKADGAAKGAKGIDKEAARTKRQERRDKASTGPMSREERRQHIKEIRETQKEDRAQRAADSKAQKKGYGDAKSRKEGVKEERKLRAERREKEKAERKTAEAGRTTEAKGGGRERSRGKATAAKLKYAQKLNKAADEAAKKGDRKKMAKIAAKAARLAKKATRNQREHGTRPILVGNTIFYAPTTSTLMAAQATQVLRTSRALFSQPVTNGMCTNCAGSKMCGACAAKNATKAPAKVTTKEYVENREKYSDYEGVPRGDVNEMVRKGRKKKKRKGNPAEPYKAIDPVQGATNNEASETSIANNVNEANEVSETSEDITNAATLNPVLSLNDSYFSRCARDDKGHCKDGSPKMQKCKCPDGTTIDAPTKVKLPREQSGSVGGSTVSVAANTLGAVLNIFCATGIGGGIKPNCPAKGSADTGASSSGGYGGVSRGGTPAARPESGQFPRQATVTQKPKEATAEAGAVKPKKSKSKKVEDSADAAFKADKLYAEHQERAKSIKDPLELQQSYTRFKKELEDFGIVPTSTGYGFKKGKGPTGNANPTQPRDVHGKWGTPDQVARAAVVSAVRKAFGPAAKVAAPAQAARPIPAQGKAGQPLEQGDEGADSEAAEAHSPKAVITKSAAGQQGVSAAVQNIFGGVRKHGRGTIYGVTESDKHGTD